MSLNGPPRWFKVLWSAAMIAWCLFVLLSLSAIAMGCVWLWRHL